MPETDPRTLPSVPSETRVAEAVTGFQWSGGKLEPGIAIALSGGGFRAMLFHAGALMRLNELGLLSKASRISSVSGGSIAAGHLASVWQDLGAAGSSGAFANFKAVVVEPLLKFSRNNLDIKNTLIGLLPGVSAAELTAKSYEKHLLGKRTLQDIPDNPVFVFCATNLQTGVLWRFTKKYAGDYLVGQIVKPDFRLSSAVAASSAFPPFLSPLRLSLDKSIFSEWPSTSGKPPFTGDLTPFRETVILSDGGVYDNHGLEPIVKRYMTLLVSDGGAPFGREPTVGWDYLRQMIRVVGVIDNQVRALRRRGLIDRFKAAKQALASGTLTLDGVDQEKRTGAYWGIDTEASSMNPPGALAVNGVLADQLARLSTRLADLGETPSKQLINWGYAIADRSVRTHYQGPIPANGPRPVWPYPETPL
jgi:NTE family protein